LARKKEETRSLFSSKRFPPSHTDPQSSPTTHSLPPLLLSHTHIQMHAHIILRLSPGASSHSVPPLGGLVYGRLVGLSLPGMRRVRSTEVADGDGGGMSANRRVWVARGDGGGGGGGGGIVSSWRLSATLGRDMRRRLAPRTPSERQRREKGNGGRREKRRINLRDDDDGSGRRKGRDFSRGKMSRVSALPHLSLPPPSLSLTLLSSGFEGGTEWKRMITLEKGHEPSSSSFSSSFFLSASISAAHDHTKTKGEGERAGARGGDEKRQEVIGFFCCESKNRPRIWGMKVGAGSNLRRSAWRIHYGRRLPCEARVAAVPAEGRLPAQRGESVCRAMVAERENQH
jgi:hypothetical protein